MKWISATDLQEWSIRTDARALLMEMVADLIRASHAQLSHFRFTSGDKAQVRGFDGDLESENKSTYIPFGKSKWEFGVSPGSDKPKTGLFIFLYLRTLRRAKELLVSHEPR